MLVIILQPARLNINEDIIIIIIIIISVDYFSTSFGDAAMTSSGDVTSALFPQMRIVSTASFGVSLILVLL